MEKNGHVGFAGNCARQQGLTGAWRSDQQHALGNAATQLLELLRFAQELDDLLQLFLGLIHAGHVLEGDLLLLHGKQAGPALAERQGLIAAALHLPQHEEPQRRDHNDGSEVEQNREPGIALRILHRDADLVVLKDLEHVRVVGGHGGVERFPVAGVVPVNFAVDDGHVADLALLAVLHELRKGNLPVMTHARALLDDLPEKNQASQDEYPENDCLDR